MARYRMPDLCGPIQLPDLTAFAQPGVYFLLRQGVVVYVGQAVDARRRIGEHIGDGGKSFDAVSFIPCPRPRLDAVERHYIEMLLPEYNRCRFARLRRVQPRQGPQAPLTDVLMPVRIR